MLKVLRRTVQILVLFIIIFIPIVSNYGTMLSGKSQRDFSLVAREDPGGVPGIVYDIIHWVVDPPFNPQETVPTIDQYKGAVWSFTIWGYNITDPLVAFVSIIAGKVLYMPVLVAIILPLLFILLLGRAFCGWICPMNTLLEIVDGVRGFFYRRGYALPDIRLNPSYRYYILAGGLAAAALGVPVVLFLLPYGLISQEVYYYIFYGTFSFGGVLILAIVAFDLFSRRGWCRYLCPGGAFFSLLSPLRIVRIYRDRSACKEDCTICTDDCTMGLEPHRDLTGIRCDNCGVCISSCPSGAMKYRLGL